MKYLNDDIEVTITFASTSKDQVLKYKISNSNNENIFVGNAFISKGSTSKTFYLNDILKTFQFKYEFQDSGELKIMDKFTLQLGYESTVLGTATTDWIILSNRYPAYKKYLDTTLINNTKSIIVNTNVFFDPDDDETSQGTAYFSNLLQGQILIANERGQGNYSYEYTPILIPHYPLVNSDKYPIRCIYENRFTNDAVWTFEGMEYYTVSEKLPSPFGITTFKLNEIDDIDGDTTLTCYNQEDLDQDNVVETTVTFALIDGCPAKYYVQWQDRYGGIQSQPFDGTDTISFAYDTTYTQTYKNENKLANNSVTTKWKLNSGWLSDKVMPIYESIFVSPFIKLYDVENDMVYDVNVSDSEYTEKTYKNQQAKLFNLELNLELNKKQLSLY